MRGWLLVLVAGLAGCAVGVGADGSPPEEAGPPETVVTVEDDGARSTDPFVLDAGDYRWEWTTSGDCFYSFHLRELDGQWPEPDLGVAGDATSGSDNVYGVEAGRWFVEVITGPAPACPWTMSLSPR